MQVNLFRSPVNCDRFAFMEESATNENEFPPLDEELKSLKPKPGWRSFFTRRVLIWVGVAILAAMSAAALPVIMRDTRLPFLSSTLTAREVVDAAPTGSLPAPAAQSGSASLPVGTDPSPQSDLSDPVSSADSQLDIDQLQALLRKINIQLKQNNDANHYLDQRLEAISALERRIASLVATETTFAAMVEERLLNLENQLQSARRDPAAPASESSAAFRRNPPSRSAAAGTRPPFRLISIDQWQNRWNAVLELEGKISMIEPPATRAGWQLLNIDPAARKARFRNPDGLEVILEASG